MQVIDSNKQQIETHEVITMAIDEQRGENSLQEDLLKFTSEASMPSADVTQIGNTVFVGHVGEGKNKTKMVGRPLNVDTARNYANNMVKYYAYLQNKGITHWNATFTGDELVPLVRIVQRKLVDTDTKLYLGQYEDSDDYGVFTRIGKEPLEGLVA